MRKFKLAFVVATFSISGFAHSQQSLDSQRLIDQAYNRALKQKEDKNTNVATKPIPLDTNKGVDPVEIAELYRKTSPKNAFVNNSDTLTIYVSTSMPKAALLKLSLQAKEVGATLALRGLVEPLGTKGALEKTIQAIEPYGTTGVSIQIDPEGFKKYNISAVPTFVIARQSESCDTEIACEPFVSVSGDVSIQFALEHLEKMGGGYRDRALPFLKRIKSYHE